MPIDAEHSAARTRHRNSTSFAFVYLSMASMPTLMIYFSLAASPTLGFMLAAAWILARNTHTVRQWPFRWLAPAVLLIVTMHFFVAASYQSVDKARALASLLPLATLLLLARYVASMLPQQSSQALHRQLIASFLFMCLLAALAVIGLQPPNIEQWRKPVFPFYEPAVFALSFVPLLLYAGISSNGWTRLGYLAIGITCTAFIQNLTLASCFFLVMAVSLRWWALLIVLFLFAIGGAQLDLSYYADRLDFSGETQNFSNLVYVQGWQMIGEAWDRSSGFGLGLQQLGANGTDVAAAEVIRALRDGEDLNILDGGFVFAKLAGEFGVLGMALGLCFILLAIRSFLALRRIGTQKTLVPALALAHCSVLGYSIELFVRGGSYFTITSTLMIASLWIIRTQRFAHAGIVRGRVRRRRIVMAQPEAQLSRAG